MKYTGTTTLVVSAFCTGLSLIPPFDLASVISAFSGGASLATFFWMRAYVEQLELNVGLGDMIESLTDNMTNDEKDYRLMIAKEAARTKRARRRSK